jgi:hypothetical protein
LQRFRGNFFVKSARKFFKSAQKFFKSYFITLKCLRAVPMLLYDHLLVVFGLFG